MNLHREKSEDNNKINTKQMSYEIRRNDGEDAAGHLERHDGDNSSRPGGERGSGNDGESELRLLASAYPGDHVDDGRLRQLYKKTGSRRKAFEDAMAWLFSPERNPDAWMIVTRDNFFFRRYK